MLEGMHAIIIMLLGVIGGLAKIIRKELTDIKELLLAFKNRDLE